jgi:hypothetical protein
MTRRELQIKLISQTIDDMDLGAMIVTLTDYLNESYDRYSDEELNEEVKEYYPDLLDA